MNDIMTDIMHEQRAADDEVEHERIPSSWDNEIVYHGTSAAGARDILAHGIDRMKSTKGYFGRGFYTTPDESLAQSNYAGFQDDDDEEPGVVLKYRIKPGARILDMRKPEDWDKMKAIPGVNDLGHDDFDLLMVANGVDGVFDRSFDGVVIYNPDVMVEVTI